jgi:hypothetical protein
MQWRGVDSSGSGRKIAAGSLKYDHHPLVSLNARNLLTRGGKFYFLRRTLLQGAKNKPPGTVSVGSHAFCC